MASTIKLKNGSGAPLASDLVAGEPALDLTNKRLYTEDSGGTVIEVGTNPTEIQIDNINIDGNTISSTDTNGNIAITPDGTGEVDISKVDIDSGTIDNTVIGGTTTAAGSFTTLQADTSLNVDGTVTADGLTVDTDTLHVDATNNRVGVGTDSPAYNLEVAGSFPSISILDTDTTNDRFRILHNGGSSQIQVDPNDVSASSNVIISVDGTERMKIDSDGDVSFRDTSANEAFYWDASAASLGIGTTSPDTQLTTYKASTASDVEYIKMSMPSWGTSTNYFKSLVWDDSGNTVAGIGAAYDGSKTNIYFHSQYNGGFKTTSDVTMAIMGNGNVGIGTDSPEGLLSFPATASNTPKIRLQSASTATDVAISSYADANGTYVSFGANHYYNSSGNDAVFEATDRSAYVALDARNSGAVVFGTNSSGVAEERMRIDSSGNLDMTAGGGDIIMANGAGIDFSASAGGGATSSLLDDYEEGTWTPGLGGTWTVNPTSISGQYIKIGQMVWLRLQWLGGSKGGATAAHFTNIPFTVSSQATGSVSNVSVADYGNALADGANRIFLTASSFSATCFVTICYKTTA